MKKAKEAKAKACKKCGLFAPGELPLAVQYSVEKGEVTNKDIISFIARELHVKKAKVAPKVTAAIKVMVTKKLLKRYPDGNLGIHPDSRTIIWMS